MLQRLGECVLIFVALRAGSSCLLSEDMSCIVEEEALISIIKEGIQALITVQWKQHSGAHVPTRRKRDG